MPSPKGGMALKPMASQLGIQHDGDGQDQRHDEAPQHVIHHRRAVARVFVMARVVC